MDPYAWMPVHEGWGIGVYGKMDRVLWRIGPYLNLDRGLWCVYQPAHKGLSKMHQGPMPSKGYRYPHKGLIDFLTTSVGRFLIK